MKTEAHTYPVWTVSFSAALGEEIQYKYIILSPVPNCASKLKSSKWEQHPNRRIVTSGTRMTVEDGTFSGKEEPRVHVSQVWSAGEYQVRVQFCFAPKFQVRIKVGDYGAETHYKGLTIFNREASDFFVSIVPIHVSRGGFKPL